MHHFMTLSKLKTMSAWTPTEFLLTIYQQIALNLLTIYGWPSGAHGRIWSIIPMGMRNRELICDRDTGEAHLYARECCEMLKAR